MLVLGRIIKKDIEKIAGNTMLVFTCESEINGLLKPYEIKYDINTMKCKVRLFRQYSFDKIVRINLLM